MKLELYARAGHLMYYRGLGGGQIPRYIGRKTSKATPEEREAGGFQSTHRALREPTSIDASSADGKEVLRRMIIDRNDPPLWPANEETARATGVAQQELNYNEADGEWLHKADVVHSESRPVSSGKKGSNK